MPDQVLAPRLLRCTLTVVAGAAATVGLGGRAWDLLAHCSPAAGRLLAVDDIVAGAVTTLGALAAGSLTVGGALLLAGATACAAGRSSCGLEAAAARFTPHLLRRVLAIAVGTGLGIAPALAAGAAEPDLGWSVTAPDDAPPPDGGPSDQPTVADPPDQPTVADPAHPRTPATVTVTPGDCLWSIAASHLPPGASDGEIARAWPQWYAANRALIGPDPGLIHPGQLLVAPEALR